MLIEKPPLQKYLLSSCEHFRVPSEPLRSLSSTAGIISVYP